MVGWWLVVEEVVVGYEGTMYTNLSREFHILQVFGHSIVHQLSLNHRGGNGFVWCGFFNHSCNHIFSPLLLTLTALHLT